MHALKRIRYFFAACLLLYAGKTSAQTVTGLTNVPDTSFSNYSAFRSMVKKYPQIKFPVTDTLRNIKAKQQIVYAKAGNTKLLMDVFYPAVKNDNNHIAILIIHGGGWRSGNRTQHHALAQHLAARGYVCFTPAYRLSTEALFPAAVFDLKAAVRWVRNHASGFDIDTSKIVAAGFSAGGELAAFLATTGNMPLFEGTAVMPVTSSRINALVDIDGTVSFVHAESSEVTDTSKRWGASAQWIGYGLKDNIALWTAASPLSHAGPAAPPTLFLNSSIARMHAGRDDYIKILSQYNIYTEVQNFENTPHTFCLLEPWFTPTVNHIDNFLKRVFNKTTKK